MKILKLSGLVPAAMMAVAVTACSSKPDIDKVKADFESPSGSVSDEQGVAAAAGKQQGTSALGAVGGGVPGVGLTAYGKNTGLARVSAHNLFAGRAVALHNQLAPGIGRSALRTAQFEDGEGDDCGNAPELAELFAELTAEAQGGATSVSGSTSYTIDAAACGGDVTGSMDVEVEIEASQESFRFTVDMTMNNVCETTGEKWCIDGDIAVEMSAQSLGGEGSFEMIQAYELTASNGEGDSLNAKGGMRLGFGSESAQLEYLFYVKASSGEEVSYVLSLTANADGSSSLEYRGSDGELTCTQDAEGNGMCSGTADFSWTDEEAEDFAELE